MVGEENQEKKPMMFVQVAETKSTIKPKPSASKGRSGTLRKASLDTLLNNPNYQAIEIEYGITVVVTKDTEEDYSEITNLSSLLRFNKKKPSNVVGLYPELFSAFVDEINNTINTYVKVGDTVKSISKAERGPNHPRKVIDVYLKSLNDMAVVIARLEDKSIHIAYTLQLCK